MTVHAAPYVQKYAPCTRCEYNNYSTGHVPEISNSYTTVPQGNYCDYCHTVVPTGKRHYFSFTSDRYVFRCNGPVCIGLSFNERSYSYYYENALKEHEIYTQ